MKNNYKLREMGKHILTQNSLAILAQLPTEIWTNETRKQLEIAYDRVELQIFGKNSGKNPYK